MPEGEKKENLSIFFSIFMVQYLQQDCSSYLKSSYDYIHYNI